MIVLLLTVTSISLLIVSFINRRQMRVRLLNQKSSQMRRRAADLEALSASVEPLLETNKVARIVNDEAIDLLKTILRISPSNAAVQISLARAKQRAQDLSSPQHKAPTYRLLESDAAIARAQFALAEAARIIRKQQAADKLQAAEMDALLRELAWSNYMIRIISNVGQGHRAANRNDSLRAIAFYRKALEVATEAGHKDERQNQIIAEIGEIMNNRRTALSTHLMPETIHNPPPK